MDSLDRFQVSTTLSELKNLPLFSFEFLIWFFIAFVGIQTKGTAGKLQLYKETSSNMSLGEMLLLQK